MTETINYEEYVYLMNRIAYWLVKNEVEFNTRQIYGYFDREADYATIINVIKERGTNYGYDSLISEFTECAIFDNKEDLSNFPKYVQNEDGSVKYDRNTYTSMALRVSAYEVENNRSPSIVYVKSDIEPEIDCGNKITLVPLLLNQGGGKLGQINAYNCGPHSLMQAYYNLTGINVSEKTLASYCGTTTAGTSHQGLATGLAKLNSINGTNVKMEWVHFSNLGFNGLADVLCDGNKTLFWHELYRNKYGHYSIPKTMYIKEEYFDIANSLGSKCNSPAYCGYIEKRTFNTQKQYWKGISQPSICILSI